MFKLLTWTHILYVYATVATSSKIEVRENSKGFSFGVGVGEEALSCEVVHCLFR